MKIDFREILAIIGISVIIGVVAATVANVIMVLF